MTSKKMSELSKSIWYARIEHIYGDLKGQRPVDIEKIIELLKITAINIDQIDIIISLESYYFLLCNFIAISSLQTNPKEYAQNIINLNNFEMRKYLSNLIDGSLFEKKGIYGLSYPFEFNWIVEDTNDETITIIIEGLSKTSNYWIGNLFDNSECDPFQRIHHSLFPKNLIHITGQFYSPEWLSELLLKEIGWSADYTLIDPFCGSGVFLNKAIELGIKNGYRINQILTNIIGIDLNPIACAAARANIVYNIGRLALKIEESININVICGDSIIPVIFKTKEKSDLLFDDLNAINMDGEMIQVPDISKSHVKLEIIKKLEKYGLNLSNWIKFDDPTFRSTEKEKCSAKNRRLLEQYFLLFIKPAKYLVTNPPWIGWEYISKTYRKSIENAWLTYDLFKVKGLDAAFLKEDISNLALLTAWDNYLETMGKSSVVLRPATMQSNLTSRGVRRLALTDNGIPLKLEKIRLFSDINVFEGANTETATWQIQKGLDTVFPINVVDWIKVKKRWNPMSVDKLSNVEDNIKVIKKIANRSVPNDICSRWSISEKNKSSLFEKIQGGNNYVPRMGVFTGGANAVFYLEIINRGNKISLCRNIIERAKIIAPIVETEIENDCIYNVLRGRDIQMWYFNSTINILCAHNIETKMYPHNEQYMKNNYPKTYKYLLSMKEILCKRNGFAGWEKEILKKYFYTLQRIGDYSFYPYKVCWKYIASEFTVCIINSSKNIILPNDKVMFIPFKEEMAAYYVGGLLSSNIVRNYINSLISKRQISTSIIQSVFIPDYDSTNKEHNKIADLCKTGHIATRNNNIDLLQSIKNELNEEVMHLYQM